MPTDLQTAHLELLLHVNRLLAEADKVRSLRDRVVQLVQATPLASDNRQPHTPRKEVSRAS